ncbi:MULTISPECIES: hypothetical protein [Streptomyces violaceusniger group]|uniref:Integral membrane protein n=3 Tax=Streptomyces violaceusniger group TaxID=2839105 RepID=A0ABN1NYP1_9ACTN|nr:MULTISPECIES: hypothetical protein [Streptomyces violaceusniger group]
MDELHYARRIARQPHPPPLVYWGVGAALAVATASLLTLFSVYGANTTESRVAYGSSGLVLTVAIGILLSGINKRRRCVFAAYAVGLQLAAALNPRIEEQRLDPNFWPHADEELDRLQGFLARSGAYRQAEALAKARSGALDG